ncbi:DUF3237 domain-containing protein [soil metagenome]
MDNLTTEFVFEALVYIDVATKIGDTALGKRRFIGITGGTFKGPRIEGEVIPGGADWQTVRADGVTVIEAIYALKTTDGAVIAVRNLGLVSPIEDGGRYVRTNPTFDAPQGPHDWLNKSIFVGTIGVAEGGKAVRIGVYRVI